MLNLIAPERLDRLAADPDFLKEYDELIELFDAALTAVCDPSGNPTVQANVCTSNIAYFSAEYGLHSSLRIYSGGLGILSGDQAKTASDIGLNYTAFGFMYPRGYFQQRIAPDGGQIADYPEIDMANVAIDRTLDANGEPLIISLPMQRPDDLLHLQVWLVRCGRVKIYLMDSNVDANDPENRDITMRLYGGDREYRLRQEIALGIGSIHVLRALGIQPDVFHANEGHVAFLFVERLRDAIKSGLTLDQALETVRHSSIFTTHTPVPAGTDSFDIDLILRYFWHYWPDLGMTKEQFFALGEHNGMFNMTALAMNLSAHRNAVSKKHREVTAAMWPEYLVKDESSKKNDEGAQSPAGDRSSAFAPYTSSLTSVTNGIHIRTWLAPEMEALFEKELGSDWIDHLNNKNIGNAFVTFPTKHSGIRGIA